MGLVESFYIYIFETGKRKSNFFLYYKVISANRITARDDLKNFLQFRPFYPKLWWRLAAQPKSKSSQLKYVFKSSSRVGGGIWSTEKPFIAKQVKYLSSAKSPLSRISIIPHEYSPVPVSFMEIRKADYYFSKNSNLFLVVEQQILAVIRK